MVGNSYDNNVAIPVYGSSVFGEIDSYFTWTYSIAVSSGSCPVKKRFDPAPPLGFSEFEMQVFDEKIEK